MASSSVSQDDIDNDFEKNSRRSRIRTARARQINPSSGCRLESGASAAAVVSGIPDGEEYAAAVAGIAEDFVEDRVGSGTGAGASGGASGATTGANNPEHDTSPKPMIRTSTKDKRPIKLHHVNKAKQQRDRRKLREKRRSTGVVHLASTESTGGSTTGDDETNSDINASGGGVSGASGAGAAANATASLLAGQHATLGHTLSQETRRNTQQNENIATCYRQAQEKLNWNDPAPPMDDHEAVVSGRRSSGPHHHSYFDEAAANGGGNEGAESAHYYPEDLPPVVDRHRHLRGNLRRDKSPSDLEADDENDHDSLNQSETGSGSNISVCNLHTGRSSDKGPSINESNVTQVSGAAASGTKGKRPTDPMMVEHIGRVVEENKRLLSLMEEKDRRIHLLEYKVQQLMRDTLTISEEQSRLQKENTTLLRALSKLTKDKAKST